MGWHTFGVYLSHVLGWVYTIAWSISFYPQTWINFRRKSVQGLSIDFLYLNSLGFLCYSIFNISMLASSVVRSEYRERNDGHDSAVRWNDVAFAVHAFCISTFTMIQSFIYTRDQNQVLSKLNRAVISIFLIVIVLSTLAVSISESLLDQGQVGCASKAVWQWLDLIYLLSYIKLYISFAKYLPQAYLNFKRKSTVGWSIHNILLDFTGGILSTAQLILDCALANDWSGITGDPVKLGLGLLSIIFDIGFMTQHYILYPNSRSGLFQDRDKGKTTVAREDEEERRRLLE
ncbi:PQ-loop-domain-containing protein [Atractiella rhizophila]|nr:PQ-loop-domain-containing protein [Atractiella rhizophila]